MKRCDRDFYEISEINMTPFVDIVLVILVIFMATATFITQNKIKINLPKASAQSKQDDLKKPIEIAISKDGSLYYDNIPVNLEALEQKLANSDAKMRGVILNCDAKTEFEKVVAVMDAAKKCNIDKFAIQTKIDNATTQ